MKIHFGCCLYWIQYHGLIIFELITYTAKTIGLNIGLCDKILLIAAKCDSVLRLLIFLLVFGLISRSNSIGQSIIINERSTLT